MAWDDFDTNMVNDVSEVATTLLIKERGLIPDGNFCFTIEGKKEENVADVLYEILESRGNTISLNELYSFIENKFPGRYKSLASIRAIVMRDPRLCLIGINNLVGLIEWNHIKIGSIREVIVQYLDKYDTPKPLSDIVEYVLKYRDTSEKSIRSTMITGDQFVHFGKGLFGLRYKKYPSKFFVKDDETLFWERIQELESFLKTNRHFPFDQSNPKEKSLYSWWHRIKRATNISIKQKNEINRIKIVYAELPSNKKTFNWFHLCQTYQNFVRIHRRMPVMYVQNEKILYNWFKKAQADFQNGELNSLQEKAFLELCQTL